MKMIKKGFFWLITCVLSFVVLFNIYNLINLKIFKNDLTSVFGYAMLEVVSGSMEPTIRVGDLVIIDTNYHDYQKNDIVTFRDTNGSFVTHRIVSIQDDKMITKGDHNNSQDEEMPTKNIVGKYLFRLQGVGTILTSLKNPVVSILIFIIGFLICYLISYDKEEKELINQEEYQEFLDRKAGILPRMVVSLKKEPSEKEILKKKNSKKNRKRKKRKKRRR